jgi:hypothetical protein
MNRRERRSEQRIRISDARAKERTPAEGGPGFIPETRRFGTKAHNGRRLR